MELFLALLLLITMGKYLKAILPFFVYPSSQLLSFVHLVAYKCTKVRES